MAMGIGHEYRISGEALISFFTIRSKMSLQNLKEWIKVLLQR